MPFKISAAAKIFTFWVESVNAHEKMMIRDGILWVNIPIWQRCGENLSAIPSSDQHLYMQTYIPYYVYGENINFEQKWL